MEASPELRDIIVGWFNWLGSDDAVAPTEDEPRDVAEREGLP